MRIIAILSALLLHASISAQISSERKLITKSQVYIRLGDTSWVFAPSIWIKDYRSGMIYSDSTFTYRDPILMLDTTQIHDSIVIHYKSFPLSINKSFFLYDSSEHHEALPPDYAILSKTKNNKPNPEWWSNSNIDYSGNYNRGISLGSNQSLIVNSALNIQLAGDLGDGVKITGAITDNQIPIQAEGNTRQIQEFDKLYIQISKNNSKLVAGDFDVLRPTGYFQNYFKKSQGANLVHKQKLNSFQLHQQGNIGISKGKFNRMNVPVRNGNQGPYRLKGRDGESFIIVLAGSEKVFLDGQLLIRGEDADYIMDYNLAEIRFTPRRLVTDQMRIIIEYEYTDQNYLRSLITYNAELQKNSWNTYLNYYRENDSKKPSVSNDLDSTEQIILAQSGDDPTHSISKRVARAGLDFKPDRVYYIYRDTIVAVNGVLTPIQYLKYQEKADSNSLQVVFTEVGDGKGEYQLIQSNANGRIYQWVGSDPVRNIPLGSYAPFKILIPPRNHQMIHAGFHYKTEDENDPEIWVEAGLSILDKNRLSKLDDGDNDGYSALIKAKSPSLMSKKIKWQSEGTYEWNDKQFVALNPYRRPEFNRDWNIDSQTGFNDQLLTLSSNLKYANTLTNTIQFSRFDRNKSLHGDKYEFGLEWKDTLTEVLIYYNVLQTSWSDLNTNFQRPGISVQRKIFKNFVLGFLTNQEKNQRRHPVSDSLLTTSFNFTVYNGFIKFQDKKNNSIRLDWRRRTDRNPISNQFQPFSISDEYTAESNLQSKKTGIWDFKLTARNLQLENEKLQDSLGQYSFLGQIDHTYNFIRNSLRLKNIYALQSGAEPRVEYVFEERRPGDGDFIYIDYNQNGIREIQEYEYAPDVDTARYVRIQLFNSEYIQAYQSSLNSNFSIDLSRLLKVEKSNTFWRRWSYESILRFSNKINPMSKLADRFNPFPKSNNSNLLIAFQKNISQQLFFNRANPKFESSVNYLDNSIQQVLISGLESRDREEWNSKTRLTLRNTIDFSLQLSRSKEQRSTEFYILQNYNINTQLVDLSAAYRMTRDFRIKFGGRWKDSEEKIKAIDRAQIFEIYNQSQWAWSRKISIRCDLRYLKINFSGAPGTAVEFVMLEGLKDGNNFTGEFLIDYWITKIISSQFSFSIRKASQSDPINTGRASIRANF